MSPALPTPAPLVVPDVVAPCIPRWQDRRRAGVLTPPPLREVDGLAIDTPPRWRTPFRSPWYYNPVFRFFVALILLAVFMLLASLVVGVIQGPEIAQSSGMAVALIGAVGAYLVLTMTVERRRPPAELAPRRVAGLFVGLGIGAGLMTAVAGVLGLADSYHVDGFNPHYSWAETVFMVGAVAGIAEEIMFRGILFRIVEEGLGTWGALLVSALVFGLVHVGNDNATLLSGLAIAVEAGLLIGVLYALTRSLWVVMGLHAAWNVVQGPVFGFPVSGSTEGGFVVSHVTGPAWLSGGSFGAEGSLVTVVGLTALAGVLAAVLVRRGAVISPAWVRRRRQRELLAAVQPEQPGAPG